MIKAATSLERFEQSLTDQQRALLNTLDSPAAIQAFLDDTPYTSDSFNRRSLRVLEERQAHCLDGGLFAALALRRLGHPPLIVDLYPEPGTDDDHVLALYRVHGRWGALAKSNFTGLRSREAVYHSLRELVMSYFDFFFNLDGMKTLRSYTRPVNLAAYDSRGWMEHDAGVDFIEMRLLQLKRKPLLPESTAALLAPADPLTYKAGLLVVNPDGLFKPGQSKAKEA